MNDIPSRGLTCVISSLFLSSVHIIHDIIQFQCYPGHIECIYTYMFYKTAYRVVHCQPAYWHCLGCVLFRCLQHTCVCVHVYVCIINACNNTMYMYTHVVQHKPLLPLCSESDSNGLISNDTRPKSAASVLNATNMYQMNISERNVLMCDGQER